MKNIIFGLVLVVLAFNGWADSNADDAVQVQVLRTKAESGDGSAASLLGAMLEAGQGTPIDYLEAMKWFRVAAGKGDYWGMYRIGGLYQHGHGVPANPVVALAIYELIGATNKSRTGGVPDHQESLLRGMSDADIKELASRANPLYLELRKPGNFIPALDQYLATK